MASGHGGGDGAVQIGGPGGVGVDQIKATAAEGGRLPLPVPPLGPCWAASGAGFSASRRAVHRGNCRDLASSSFGCSGDGPSAATLGPLQPGQHLGLHHLKGWGRMLLSQAAGHRRQIGPGDGGDASVLLDGHHLGGPPLQGFAGHYATAAAKVQPATAGQLRRQQIEHRLAHPGGGGPGQLAGGALQATPAAETQAHRWATQSSQRCNIATPTGPDFSGWNWQAAMLSCQIAAVTGVPAQSTQAVTLSARTGAAA